MMIFFGGLKIYDRAPPEFFLHTNSEDWHRLFFKKHHMISVRFTVFVLSMKMCQKKLFFSILRGQLYESFFKVI